ncbi:MAG TPA: hypothetical protein VEA69_19850 [Tepidisphaeraceae bacterium]|nr:hypothetical protein [Tepidisphaeraceae bacterium]
MYPTAYSLPPTSARRRVLTMPGAALALVVLLHATPVPAGDFADGDAGWTRYDPLAPHGVSPATFEFPDENYRIIAGQSHSPAQHGPSRAGSFAPGTTPERFRATVDLVDWDDSHDQAIGLWARVGTPGFGTTTGYALTYSVGSREINLTRVTNEAPAANLDESPVVLTRGHRYRLVLTGDGPALVGAVYSFDDLGAPLATVGSTDATYATGAAGLIVFDNTDANTADATFDRFIVTPLPEPGAALTLLVAVAVLARRAPRRARCR